MTDNNNNMEDLFNKATEKTKVNTKRKNTKLVTFISVGVLLAAGIAGGTWYFLNNNDDNPNGTLVTQETTDEDIVPKDEEELTDEELARLEKAEEKKLAQEHIDAVKEIADVDDWQAVTYNPETGGTHENPVVEFSPEEIRENFIDYAQGTSFVNMSGSLPGEKDGFTSDRTQQLTSDGNINPYYVPVTSDDLNETFGNYINRLLNPVFGGWDSFQNMDNRDVSGRYYPADMLFGDMFTSEWWNNNITESNYSALPILVNRWGENYGGHDLDYRANGVFFGNITDVSLADVFERNVDGTILMSYKIRVNVDYIAQLANGEKLVKKGVTTLTLETNPHSEINPHKLLINEVEYSIE